MAPSHLYRTLIRAAAAAEMAETAKAGKYSGIGAEYDFVPFGVETLGPWGPCALSLFKDLSKRLRIPQETEELAVSSLNASVLRSSGKILPASLLFEREHDDDDDDDDHKETKVLKVENVLRDSDSYEVLHYCGKGFRLDVLECMEIIRYNSKGSIINEQHGRMGKCRPSPRDLHLRPSLRKLLISTARCRRHGAGGAPRCLPPAGDQSAAPLRSERTRHQHRREAGGGSGGASSPDTVAQSAAGRRVASTIDFLHATLRERILSYPDRVQICPNTVNFDGRRFVFKISIPDVILAFAGDFVRVELGYVELWGRRDCWGGVVRIRWTVDRKGIDALIKVI
ncbi:hypothetical protein MSG28_003552 [Choristoneura fumiferana]|uniref:Uncharacterized protein n=1 Tax=Choristoneura fumiferana TaxID=7141 RepID=A0ACC0KG55_CHOFU|nr:hypothetical protein MSG28_003552 [Choristoneura fumiferana]